MRVLCSVLLLSLGCTLANSQPASDSVRESSWHYAVLPTGEPYWWRPSQLLGVSEPEITFVRPDGVWQKGALDNGSPYLWRKSSENAPVELEMWTPARCDRAGGTYQLD